MARKKPGTGRKTKLTEELKKRFLDTLRMGAHISVACRACGIREFTYREWMARGRGECPRGRVTKPEDKELFASFVADVEAAIAESELILLNRIRNASIQPNNWRAAAWIMEKRFPERYSDRWRAEQEAQKRYQEVLDRLEKVLPPEQYQQALIALAGENDPVEIEAEDDPSDRIFS